MKTVVFVAPYLGATMLEALEAFCGLADVRLGVISHQPQEVFPSAIRRRLAGHYRVSNALDADELTRATRMFQEEWSRVDCLVGYLEHLQGPLAEVRTRLGIDGMKRQAASNFRDKNTMKAVLRDAGLPVAAQARVQGYSEVKDFVERVGFPIVLKPIAGVGSKNTMRVSDEAELMSALNLLLPSEANPIQAEKFIQGQEYTLEAVSVDGQVVWQSSSRYFPGPLQVIENFWIQYCVLLPREQHAPPVESFRSINAEAVASLGMETGLSHMEWFVDVEGKPVISEVGGRPPGVNLMPMMGVAHGVNMWEKWARLVVFGEWDMPPRTFAVGCAFLRGSGGGRTVARVRGLAEVQGKVQGMVIDSRLPRVGQGRSTHYEGDGWVIVRHPDTEVVIQALKDLITTIEVEYV